MKHGAKKAMTIENLAAMTARGFAGVTKQFDDLRLYVDGRFDKVEKRLDAIEKRIDAVEKRLDTLEDSFEYVARRVERIEDRQMDNHATRLARIEAKLFGAGK